MELHRHRHDRHDRDDRDDRHADETYENLSIKVHLGALLFELLLDTSFEPIPIDTNPQKHNHYAFEVHCFMSGYGSLFVGQQEIPVVPGSVHVIGPGVYHQFKERKETPLRRYTIQFVYTKTGAVNRYASETELLEIARVLEHVRYFQIMDAAPILLLLESIERELETPALGRYTNIQSLFVQIVVRLVRSISPDSYPYTLPNKSKDDMRTRIIDTFFSDYKQDGTMEDLANELNLSVRQTNRILKRYYNTTFKQKMLDTRMEVAKDWLIKSELTIQQIAEKLGYSATNNFHDIFAKKTGMTPSQFRSAHQRPFPIQII